MESSDDDFPEEEQSPLNDEVLGAMPMPAAVRGHQIDPVRQRFIAIIGSEIRQKELMALRRGLFADILPPMDRQEKRVLSANLMGFNRFQEIILARLNDPAYVSAVLDEVLRCRTNPRDRELVLNHARRLDLI
jgi:hypothetical protein